MTEDRPLLGWNSALDPLRPHVVQPRLDLRMPLLLAEVLEGFADLRRREERQAQDLTHEVVETLVSLVGGRESELLSLPVHSLSPDEN